MPTVRVQAVGVIGFLKLEEAMPALSRRLSRSRRARAARRGQRAGASRSRSPPPRRSSAALADDDWMVREMAAETLGARDRRCSRGRAADRGAGRRVLAGAAQGDAQPRPAEDRARGAPPSASCSTHAQANLRKEAAAALGEIADPAALAVPAKPCSTIPTRTCARTRAGR